jgi:hypothetical protein
MLCRLLLPLVWRPIKDIVEQLPSLQRLFQVFLMFVWNFKYLFGVASKLILYGVYEAHLQHTA